MMIEVMIEATALQGERSGVGSYLVNLIYNFTATDVRYHLMLGRGIFPWRRAETIRAQASLQTTPQLDMVMPFFPYWPSWLTESVFQYWYLPGLLRRQGPHLFFAPNFILPPRLPREMKTIITVHDVTFLRSSELVQRQQRQLLVKHLKSSCDRAHGIIAVSQSTRDDLVELLGVSAAKIKVIYEGTAVPPAVSATEEEKILRKFGIREPFILYLGNIEPRKNLVRLVRAHHQLETPLQLVLAGSQNWHYPELYREVEGKDVVMTGYLRGREVGALLRRALFFVYPSLYEGFGLPPLEAMGTGCPVIAARAGSLPEVLGEASEWVDPQSTDDIVRALETLWQDKRRRQELREKGFARAKKFCWSRAAQDTIEFFREVVG